MVVQTVTQAHSGQAGLASRLCKQGLSQVLGYVQQVLNLFLASAYPVEIETAPAQHSVWTMSPANPA